MFFFVIDREFPAVKKMLTVCPTIEVVDEHDLNTELDGSIRELLRLCFPDWADIFQNYRMWYSTRPIYSVVARDEEKIIGHIAAVVRAITTTWNFRYNVVSIQGVCVAPDSRHAGLAHQMLREALNEAVRRGFLFAILYCKEFLVPFYASQGWKLADDSIVMWNQRDLPVSMRSNCPMYYELSDVPLPEGPLDVHSPTW
ncbi:MAG: GNAT family N-acetyltransferase [Planctomycetaceae bacterium]|nr:GNAT family N-acetyltransferase [Planctomycetaceae bacterium]